MLNFFRKDPIKTLQKAYETKLTDAQTAQRNGDIRSYSLLSEEADALYHRLQAAKTNSMES